MSKFLNKTLFIIIFLICGCSDEFQNEAYIAGPNGEPPKVLKGFQTYTKQFVADQKNYMLALGIVHRFLIVNHYSPFYTSCLDDVLDIRVTADFKKHKKRVPCVVLQAQNGVPTKGYVSITVEDVMFNQLDHNNRLFFTVSMFGKEDLAKLFASKVEPDLFALYTGISPSENSSAH